MNPWEPGENSAHRHALRKHVRSAVGVNEGLLVINTHMLETAY